MNYDNNKRYLPCLLVLMWLLGAYCRPHHDGNDITPQPGEGGAVCEKGIPAGGSNSKRIGINGGTVTSTDGRIAITIPAGALTGDTTIEIQPVTNTNPAGNGFAYRLTPHGKIFQKPVNISFSYIYADSTPKVPEVQGIAYQDDHGIWQSVGNGSIDTVAKKATIQTNHFSDWSQFESARLLPGNAVITVGDVLNIRAVQYIPDGLMISPLTGGKDVPVMSEQQLPLSNFKNWRLSGIGKLSPHGQYATYEAPKIMNNVRGSAAVSIELNTPKGNILLISNINIVYEGIVLRINGGDWIQFTKDQCSYSTEPFSILGEKSGGAGISIQWARNESRLSWGTSVDGLIPGFVYTTEGGVYSYTCLNFVGPNEDEVASPGYLMFNHFPVNQDNYVAGSFLIEKGAKMDAGGNKVADARVEGYFRVPTQ